MNLKEIRTQLGTIYDRFSPQDQTRHLELLERIRRPDDVEMMVDSEGEGRWKVTVCTSDCVGILSILAGLFAANRIDILSGDLFTLRYQDNRVKPPVGRKRRPGLRRKVPAPQEPARKILDIFQAQTDHDRDAPFWEALRDDLSDLVALVAAEGNPDAAREKIIDRVSDVARAAGEPEVRLFPVAVELDNDVSPRLTQVSIRSTDTLGFLFEFSNALTTLKINIERVQIRTENHEAHDTFWVTDSRGDKIIREDRLDELRVNAVLIKQFTHMLPHSPDPAQAIRQFSALTGQMLSRPDWASDLGGLDSDKVLSTLAELMGMSQFLWEDFLRMQHENLFPVLRDVPAMEEAKSKDQLEDEITGEFHSESGYSEDVEKLNLFKDREMFRIDLRHITRRIDFVEFSDELSDLGEVVVAQAAEISGRLLEERYGRPLLKNGDRCPWCILALGKFGGRELGFASDIELLFIYGGEGASDGAEVIDNSRYFEELVSTFQNTLRTRREGIFEVDMRLRPYGKAGSLASSLEGFKSYFSSPGSARHFERMAMVKLRPVVGDKAFGEQLIHARDRFVYSEEKLDYKDILHLRGRQARELVPAGKVSAKHSPGGLVDVEYFVQAQQIEAGRPNPSVRVTNTLEAIARLVEVGCFKVDMAEELRVTYGFLRRLIDALRVVRGHAKDLTIEPSGSRQFAYLARRLRFDSTAELEEEIGARMGFARDLWEKKNPKSKIPNPKEQEF